jgi:DNA-binding SARP family transcriptional activator/DNA-binding beta-propeller fold protein YncE
MAGARGGGARLELGILGPLSLTVGGEARPVAGDKLQALLARLVLDANRAVATERLIDELWGDEPPATARQSLHVHVGRLRRLLADGTGPSPLETTGSGYLLRLGADELDALRFRSLVESARVEQAAGRLGAAGDAFREALALWRGDALEGIALPWAETERARLAELRLGAVEERIDVELRLGRAAELVPELERLVEAEPLRERLRGQLMLALYAAGRQADALVAYQRARRELDQVGLQPGPRLRELEQAILRQDPALTTAPLGGAAAQPTRHRRRLGGLVLAALATAVVGAALVALRDEPPRAAHAGQIVVGPDSLVEIDPATNRVVSAVRVGSGPDSIASTEDAIWVANTADRTVSRIDLATREARVVGGAPVAHQLASGLSGDVWLSSFEEPVVTLIARGGRALGEGAVVAAPFRVGLPGSAEGLATGGGYLWVTSPSDSGGRDTVSRIDLRSRRLVASTEVGPLPLFAAFGYGSAWVSNYHGSSVSVVRPGSAAVETVAVGRGPLGIAAGQGGVWVVSYWDRTLTRIDPETRQVVGRVRLGAGPLGVAAGAGAVWVTNRDDRTVVRVDPGTDRVVRTIRLRASPYGIRVAHGRVWVTTQRCGSPAVPC